MALSDQVVIKYRIMDVEHVQQGLMTLMTFNDLKSSLPKEKYTVTLSWHIFHWKVHLRMFIHKANSEIRKCPVSRVTQPAIEIILTQPGSCQVLPWPYPGQVRTDFTWPNPGRVNHLHGSGREQKTDPGSSPSTNQSDNQNYW